MVAGSGFFDWLYYCPGAKKILSIEKMYLKIVEWYDRLQIELMFGTEVLNKRAEGNGNYEDSGEYVYV